jgi:uncharacterized protein (TIGR02147 family)
MGMRNPLSRPLFSYTDYRTFLADYMKEEKKRMPIFSFRYFSNKAGFKSRDFLYKVIGGKKNLSSSSVFMISQAIGFNQREAGYFEALVGFNQAKNHKERDAHFAKMQSAAADAPDGGFDQPVLLSPDQYEFFSAWYHTAIRSYIDLHPFTGDCKALAKSLQPSITPAQARESVDLLERLCLIKRGTDGVFRVVSRALKTGEGVRQHAMDKLYRSFMTLAERALDNVARDRRNLSALTVGISRDTYEEMTKRIQAFRQELADLANRDEKADRVYQLTVHFFPLSKSDDHEQ